MGDLKDKKELKTLSHKDLIPLPYNDLQYPEMAYFKIISDNEFEWLERCRLKDEVWIVTKGTGVLDSIWNRQFMAISRANYLRDCKNVKEVEVEMRLMNDMQKIK